MQNMMDGMWSMGIGGLVLLIVLVLVIDPPPLKWSDSKYGFRPEEDCNALLRPSLRRGVHKVGNHHRIR